MWQRSPRCWIASCIMGMCSNAARAVGAPKQRQPLREACSDSHCRGLSAGRCPQVGSPLRPGQNQKPKKNLSMKEKEGKRKDSRALLPVGREHGGPEGE